MPRSEPSPAAKTWHTRFAPSPTGYLHLGHLLSCAFIFGIGRNLSASIDLRLENHDQKRCLPQYMDAIYEDLAWCGFQFDNQQTLGAPVPPDSIQSHRNPRYKALADQIKNLGLIYSCDCSRNTQKQRGCKTVGSHLIYDNHCRDRQLPFDNNTWRLRFELGSQSLKENGWSATESAYDFMLKAGDFPIRDRDAFWTYQWAVVCDDLDQNIDLVIRGLDLWPTTRRYAALWTAMAPLRQLPIFVHHPLILGDNGQKISKSDLAKPLREWRREGHTPESLIALAFQAIGYGQDKTEISQQELAAFVKTTLSSELLS